MYEFAGRFNRKDLFIKEFDYWVLCTSNDWKLYYSFKKRM